MDLIRTQSSVAPFIEIVSEYKEDTVSAEAALKKIASGKNGSALLKEIKSLSTDGREVSVRVSDKLDSRSIPFLTTSQLKKYSIDEKFSEESNVKAEFISRRKNFFRKGEGVSAIVEFNPTEAIRITDTGWHFLERNKEQSFITLAHELVHAYRYLRGDHYPQSEGLGDEQYHREEMRAIGTGEFESEKFSENKIRQEHGINLRTEHESEILSPALNFQRNLLANINKGA